MNTPKPKIHKGDLYAEAGKTYDFEEITGSLDASGADTKTAFPKLTTVGGSLDARGADTKTSFPLLKTQNAGAETALSICRAALTAALAIHGLFLSDGILAESVSKRGNVSRVKIVGQQKISYIVRQGDHTAHGKTLAEARADLLVKLGNRDTTPYKSWTPKTEVSLEEMIVAYRTITGACGAGVSHFLSSKNYKGKLSVAFVIKETEGRYGHETFKGFFSK